MAGPPPILCVAGDAATPITAGLIRRAVELGGHPVGMIPVSTGCAHDDKHDLVSREGERFRAARGRPLPPLVAAPYRFATDASPLLAARRAGISLQLEHLVQATETAGEHGDVVFVALPAGALTPIAEDGCGLDLAARLKARVLGIVDAVAGGAETRALELIEAIRARGLEIGGLILTAPSSPGPELEARIAERGRVRPYPVFTLGLDASEAAAAAYLAEHRVLEQAFAPAKAV